MSRSTLSAAKAELYGLISTDDSPVINGIDAVYDHLPPYSTLTGAVSLAVFTAAVDADFWHIGLRLLMLLGVDAKTTQDSLDLLLPLIDAATNNGGFGPSAWDIGYPSGSDTQVMIATCIYQVGREQY